MMECECESENMISTSDIESENENKNNRIITCRRFNLSLVSAQNLQNVREVFDNRVEARVIIGDEDSTQEKRSKPDKHNGLNPAWNQQIQYLIADSVVQHDVPLVIKLYSHRRLLRDKYIGEAHHSVKALFEHENAPGRYGSATLVLTLTRGSAPIDVLLNITYSFGERFGLEKPALWEKILVAGTRFAIRLAFNAIAGVDVDIPISVEHDNIVGAP